MGWAFRNGDANLEILDEYAKGWNDGHDYAAKSLAEGQEFQ
jgi:hypothetical protein